jgi:hypothetical protein
MHAFIMNEADTVNFRETNSAVNNKQVKQLVQRCALRLHAKELILTA